MKKNILLLILLSVSIIVVAQKGNSENLPFGASVRLSNGTYKNSQFSNPELFNPLVLPAFLLYHPVSPYTSAFGNTAAWNLSLNDSTFRSRFLFAPFNEQVSYIGFGSYNNIGASLMWMPVRRLSIDGSFFLSKQYGNILFSDQISYGASVGLNYHFTDKMYLSIWGQYFAPVADDPFLETNSLFMKTKVGGALIVEPTGNLKFGVGVEYQHNQKEQKWESESGGKVSIGF
ncbi:MAG: hypothetical protein LBV74_07260 [Tannerella sp.]|jgi:hypothetical protein|nr:hypothetical protein [Tannerella sp.]